MWKIWEDQEVFHNINGSYTQFIHILWIYLCKVDILFQKKFFSGKFNFS